MDPFEKRPLLPVEVMITLAINLIVAVLGYYAIMTWDFPAAKTTCNLAGCCQVASRVYPPLATPKGQRQFTASALIVSVSLTHAPGGSANTVAV
jgi:hypothetical protein